jgi:hypothetical protein
MKFGELVEKYDSLVKSAFIPNPEAMQQEQQLQQLVGQVQQALASQPPQVQQQIQGFLGQLASFPPAEQIAQLSNIASQLSAQAQPATQEQAPASTENNMQAPADAAGATEAEQPGFAAENSLDNTKVTLSVRELLDLSSGGKATQSFLKVKQMAEAHNKKMEAAQQQQDMQAAEQAQQDSAMSQGGGIYAQPMGGASA